ncbi:hypothetical protein N656DRAFT_798987 [Canariomyces notabilis]|uniref:C2H2-type domain-containing protein n=1 Tax=Canariomyces notabilis TaxID=2074819 RepID=A0AAN6YRC0_9PEZI|nr:hypothetical protein N656DRAFT_798987 [Canariomyces arenarius]
MSSRQDPGVVDEMADSDMEYFFDFEAYFRHENAVDQVPVESALGVLEAKGAGPDPSEQVPTNDPAARDMGTVPHAQMQPGRAPAPQLPDPRYSGTGKRDLERHREYEHGGSTPHVCQHDGCANIGKDFKRADRLKAHALACHR